METTDPQDPLDAALSAVVNAAVVASQQQARRLHALPVDHLALPAALAGQEHLLALYLQSRAGIDVTREVVLLRRDGVTWTQIGAATGMTRQSAHERWASAVDAILNRYGTGELASLAQPDAG